MQTRLRSLLHCRLVVLCQLFGYLTLYRHEPYTAIKADFPMDKVYFHGNNKTADEIELAVKNAGKHHS